MLPLPVTIPVCIALIAGIGYWLARIAQDRRSSATPEQTGRNGGNTAAQRDAHSDAHAVADTVPIDNGDEELVERVNALLPQTQCAQCGHPGCRPYAQAIIHDNAAINRCPPGGDTTITQLAELLGLPVIALDAEVGEEPPAQVALIDEAACIGCTLCIHACPVDAIVGTSKMMHTVVSDQCTGCELCIPPCPVDCISLPGKPLTPGNWTWPKPV